MNILNQGLTFSLLAAMTLLGCGGGGGSSESGTAAQYFTKTAVGNTWTSLFTSNSVVTSVGSPTQTTTTTGSEASVITTSIGGIVTTLTTSTSTETVNGILTASSITNTTKTDQIDTTGAWVSTNVSGGVGVVLPAKFSVGTTWAVTPAILGQPALTVLTGTIIAFNVSRTVPGGTFTDCLRLTIGDSITAPATVYISPSAGAIIETKKSYSISSGATSENVTYTRELQAGYIAQ
jgi:hypothetical protein